MEPKKIPVIQIKASSGDTPRASERILRIHCHGQVTTLGAHPCPTVAISTPSDLPLHTEAEKLSSLDSRLKMVQKRKQESRPRYFMHGYNDRPRHYFTSALMGIKESKNCV